jgi:hypothetical protein
MLRLGKAFALVYVLIVTASISAQPTPTLTPVIPIKHLADFTGDGWVNRDDLVNLLNAWRKTTSVAPLVRANVDGRVVFHSECGECAPFEGNYGLWAFLDGAQGSFATPVKTGGAFHFAGIPVGTYRMHVDDKNERTKMVSHTVDPAVVVTETVLDLGDVCVWWDVDASCGGKCPVDRWFATFGTEDSTATGFMDLNADGTLHADMTLEVTAPAGTMLISLDGTWVKDEACGLTFTATISPRGDGGDCQTTGTLTATNGVITDFCTQVSGYFEANVSYQCPSGTFPEIGAGYYGLVAPENKQAPIALAAEETTELSFTGIQPAISKATTADYDLDDDGEVNHQDLLIFVEQWKVQFPTAPTCTPRPSCTASPTEDQGGTPGPTETPFPETLAGWWTFDWHITQPFTLNFTTQDQLGDPGDTDTDFNLGDYFQNATALYTYDSGTGQFVLHVEGAYTDPISNFHGAFSFDASGTVTPDHLRIINGTLAGTATGPLGGNRTLAGTFEGYACCEEGLTVDCACNRP